MYNEHIETTNTKESNMFRFYTSKGRCAFSIKADLTIQEAFALCDQFKFKANKDLWIKDGQGRLHNVLEHSGYTVCEYVTRVITANLNNRGYSNRIRQYMQ